MSDWETNGGVAGDGVVEPDENRWLALAVVLAGAFLILLASTIVNVAVPTIQTDLGASYAAIEWIISGYALAYGLLLIPAGRLGDRLGYKLMFLVGLAGFMLASVLSAISTSPAALVGWQVAAGAMAGVMNPQILAVIQVAFPPQERGRAFGMYGAVAGIAVAAGPLLGGLLIQWDVAGLSWRPIFLLNVLVGALAFAAALRLLPESRGRGGSLDVVGVALVSAAFLLLTFPLVEGRSAGWPLWAFVCLVASVPTLAGFVLWELRQIRKGRDPLVDVRLFKNRAFAAGTGISLTYFAGFIGLVFVLSLYLQIGLGRSALITGLILLPFAAGSFVGAAFSDRVADRLGKWVLLLGSGAVIVGIAGVVVTVRLAGTAVTGFELLPSLLVAGLGSGLVISPNVDIVLSAVPWQQAGSASGVLNAAQRLGNALGVAVVGLVLFGALAQGAQGAATEATPELRQDLTAVGLSERAADAAASEFTRCFVKRNDSTDPTATPPGCPEPEARGPNGNPTSTAFADAANSAVATNFTRAVQPAALCALGAVVVSFLLVFLLPQRKPESQEW